MRHAISPLTIEKSKPLVLKNHGFSELQRNLNEMRTTEGGTDLIIICDGIENRGQKHFLSRWSNYISRIISNPDFVHTECDTIYLEGFDGQILKSVIDLLYTNHLLITIDNVQQIYITAHYLEIEFIQENCIILLNRNIHLENCLKVMDITLSINKCGDDLFDRAKRFVEINFVDIAKTNDFLKLNIEKIDYLLNDLKLCFPDEESFFVCLIDWLKYDLTDRLKYCNSLMNYIHYESLSRDYIRNVILENEVVVKAGLISLNKSVVSQEGWYDKRIYLNEAIIICGNNEYDPNSIKDTREMVCHNFKTNEWFDYGKLPYNRCSHCVVALENKIYILGGKIGDNLDEITNRVDIFDPITFKWKLGKPMIIKRYDFFAAVINNKIYIVGGKNLEYKSTPLEGEMYDINLDEWSLLTELQYVIPNRRIAFKNEKIYIFGFLDPFGTNIVSVTRIFDVNTSEWIQIDIPEGMDEQILLTDMIAIGVNDVHLFQSTRLEDMCSFNIITNDWSFGQVIHDNINNPNDENVLNMPLSYNEQIYMEFDTSDNNPELLTTKIRKNFNRLIIGAKIKIPDPYLHFHDTEDDDDDNDS